MGTDEIYSGRYRVLGRLGEGGMGEVFLVEHLALGRREAIKVLRPEIAADPHFVSRFRREARATHRVQHPNIVAVYDFGRLPDGRLYLAMEYAEGSRLDRVLARSGALPVDRALGVLLQLAEAVDFAHSRGVVHRDLKPSNIILLETSAVRDAVKVLDFGLAKILAPDYQESLSPTRKGETFGTLGYMAPEQLMALGHEPRSDLYALGCIGFELLTGRQVFVAERGALREAHLSGRPLPPSAVRGVDAIPPALDAIILRCLAKSPAGRYDTAHDLAAALRQLDAVPARPARRTLRGIAPGELRRLVPDGVTREIDVPLPAGFDLGTAHTEPLATGDPVAAYRAALIEAAETVLDARGFDSELIVAVDDVRALDSDKAQLAVELVELQQRADELALAARQRESQLRFAIAELQFETHGAGGGGDAARQELERRLAKAHHDFHEALGRITDRAVEATAAVDAIESSLEAACAELDRLVCARVGNAATDSAIARVARRLDIARAARAPRSR